MDMNNSKEKPFDPNRKLSKKESRATIKTYETYLINERVDPEERKRRLNTLRTEFGLHEDIEEVTEILPAILGKEIAKACIRISRQVMKIEHVEMFLRAMISVLNEEISGIENCRFWKRVKGGKR